MVETIVIKPFKYQETGTVDWSRIIKSFEDIQAVLNEHANELKALAKHQTSTVSMMFQTRGNHVLVNPGKHIRCKVTHAFAIVHDNIDEEVNVTLTGLSRPVKFNGSEKKGSGKIFDLVPNAISHFVDDIAVELTANRRVSVYATFESTEEGN